MRKLTFLMVALVFAFAAVPAAASHDSGVFRGRLEGGSMPIYDVQTVEARCPSGYEWILQTFGSGELRTAVYAGDFTYVGEHCSRWLAGPPTSTDGRFPGRVGDGEIRLSTPEGDLVLTYRGTFVFEGDVTVPEFTAKVSMRYRVDEDQSTGIFEDASGRGHMFVRDNTGYQIGRLVGSLHIEG